MKTALITGANRGLGKGFTEFLLSEGYIVFAGARDISTISSNNSNLIPIRLDVSDDNQIKSSFKEVNSQIDSLDFIINSAGLNKNSAVKNKKLVCSLKDLDRDALLHMFNINAVSPMLLIKYFLPLLTSKPSFVINISSNRASFHDEMENYSANYGYRASKVALNMFTYASLLDLPETVKTFAVHPGSVKTDINPRGTISPLDAAMKIMSIPNNWTNALNGKYLNNDGTLHPV